MKGQRIGYIRVSTYDQNPERQLEGIELDRVFTDQASGKNAQRVNLEELMSFVRSDDIVYVHSMDRLARNLDDLRQLVQSLTERGVEVRFIKESLSFTGEDSPMATLMLVAPRNKGVRSAGYLVWVTGALYGLQASIKMLGYYNPGQYVYDLQGFANLSI